MCSILGILDIAQQADMQKLRSLAIENSKKQRHRGPDWSGVWQNNQAILVHERLAIVDIDSGEQPLANRAEDLVLLVNGEIYNHKQLEKAHITHKEHEFQTKSDCEIISALYAKSRIQNNGDKLTNQQIEALLNQLQGMFAFILFDVANNQYLIARDPIGIIPLYYGYDNNRQLYVASEMKAITDLCEEVYHFPPGHYLYVTDSSSAGEHKILPYYQPSWFDYQAVAKNTATDQTEMLKSIEKGLIDSVKKHMMSDVPYGVLLSGGLDSSIIAAITQLNAGKRIEDDQKSSAWWPKIHSFAIGLKGSPDLAASQKVADAIGTVHHPIEFTIEQGIDALSDVIYYLETYDVTTIRASTPMFIMARKIKSMGIKMVLSGEGADEIFGGYLYFHKAPDAESFHQETVRKLQRLYQFDCLRANKAMAAWGVEARVPFLDREFLDIAMNIDAKQKMCTDGKIEKHILRQAFENYLPKEIIWRQKEQFSDGVGYSWIDALKDHAESAISDAQMQRAAIDFPINTPDSKEGLYYRKIFASHFKTNSAAATVMGGKSVACSTKEALEWDESFKNQVDPSGRAVTGVHQNAS